MEVVPSETEHTTLFKKALYNLGYEVGRGTIANALKREGRRTRSRARRTQPWSVFLKAHWRSIVAADFFTAESNPRARR